MKNNSNNNLTKKQIVIIPSYNPNENLLLLCQDLTKIGLDVLVINDGSDKKYDDVFLCVKKMGIKVLEYRENAGKGVALKMGLDYCIKNNLDAITADGDGQHAVEDIKKVADLTYENPGKLILGVRNFDNTTPLRSKFGNTVTKYVFYAFSGKMLIDTQTGLRGMSNDIINKLIAIKGDRYEYEMNVLLALKSLNIEIVQCPIKVIYYHNNKASHFKTIKDSYIIYKQIIDYVFNKDKFKK